ncbi:hypothetical protein LCGC14_3027090, partial [marine sediment metagenome]
LGSVTEPVTKPTTEPGSEPHAEPTTEAQSSDQRKEASKNSEEGLRSIKKKEYVPFENFWIEYPKKQAKKEAAKAWDTLKPNELLFTKILKGLNQAKQSRQWRENIIPNAATWLRGERWNDEISDNDDKTHDYQKTAANCFSREPDDTKNEPDVCRGTSGSHCKYCEKKKLTADKGEL